METAVKIKRKQKNKIHYGVNFDNADSKVLTQALINNIRNKTNRSAGDIMLSAMIEYNKMFDDKGNFIEQSRDGIKK